MTSLPAATVGRCARAGVESGDMIDAALESRAFRRELLAGLLGLVLGFGVIHGAVIYFLAAYMVPDEGGWSAFHIFIRALPLTLLATGGSALAAMTVVQRWHYRRGVYRCFQCGRARRGTGSVCECFPPEFHVRPRRRRPMRHYRRRVMPVLLAYLAIVPVAFAAASFAPGRGDLPFAIEVAVGHAMFCLLGGIGINLACAILELFRRGRRFRLRAAVFLRVFALWPLACFVAGMTLAALGYG